MVLNILPQWALKTEIRREAISGLDPRARFLSLALQFHYMFYTHCIFFKAFDKVLIS